MYTPLVGTLVRALHKRQHCWWDSWPVLSLAHAEGRPAGKKEQFMGRVASGRMNRQVVSQGNGPKQVRPRAEVATSIQCIQESEWESVFLYQVIGLAVVYAEAHGTIPLLHHEHVRAPGWHCRLDNVMHKHLLDMLVNDWELGSWVTPELLEMSTARRYDRASIHGPGVLATTVMSTTLVRCAIAIVFLSVGQNASVTLWWNCFKCLLCMAVCVTQFRRCNFYTQLFHKVSL